MKEVKLTTEEVNNLNLAKNELEKKLIDKALTDEVLNEYLEKVKKHLFLLDKEWKEFIDSILEKWEAFLNYDHEKVWSEDNLDVFFKDKFDKLFRNFPLINQNLVHELSMEIVDTKNVNNQIFSLFFKTKFVNLPKNKQLELEKYIEKFLKLKWTKELSFIDFLTFVQLIVFYKKIEKLDHWTLKFSNGKVNYYFDLKVNLSDLNKFRKEISFSTIKPDSTKREILQKQAEYFSSIIHELKDDLTEEEFLTNKQELLKLLFELYPYNKNLEVSLKD